MRKFKLRHYIASEHNEQVSFFKWAKLYSKQHPEVSLMFAIPNGGMRDIITATKLKAEGVKAGVPDIFLPVARGKYHGLFIEMKSKKGKVSPNQYMYIKKLSEQGYLVSVCYGWEQASKVVSSYIEKLL